MSVDEGYVGFMLGVDQMKKRLAEKDKEIERLKVGLRKLWYVCRERRKRPYIDHREYNFLFGIEGKLESLLATDTNVPANAPDTNVGTMEG